MQLLIVSFVIIATVIAIMSVGVIFGRKPVQGSCGGLNRVEGMGNCEICGDDVNKCENAEVAPPQDYPAR